VTLEERRHRREYFILWTVLGTMFDLFAADLITNSPRSHLQGTTDLPSFRKGCTSIAVLPRIIRPGKLFPSAGNFAARLLISGLLLAFMACGQSAVRPIARIAAGPLARPTRILLCDFTVNEIDVSEYQGIMRQQPANPNAAERQRNLGKFAADTLAAELAQALRQLGFTVDRVPRATPVESHDLLIDGQFENVDEGSPLRRLFIGFGSGAAKMETRARVYQGAERRKLLEFITTSDSGKFPGAVATAPAGIAAPATVGVGTVGSRVITSGPADVAAMAAANADQAARYLSEFFARQGWVDAAKVKKARIGY
jgi:hypothetical protein